MRQNIGTSVKQNPPKGPFDVIVIGSGIGGLAAAAVLAKRRGKRVLVLERHYVAGGFTHVFTRPGFEWDVGIHYIGNVGTRKSPVRRLFDEITDRKLNWNRQPDCYDRVSLGERDFDLVAGRDAFRDKLVSYFPSEGRTIDRYLAEVDSTVKWGGLYFSEKLLPSSVATVAGPLMRAPFLRSASRTTADVMGGITRNRELSAVLTGQYGDYGLPPGQASFAVHAFVVDHYLRDGGFYPVGGASEIATHATDLIESHGGRVAVKADVQEILLEKNRAVGVKLVTGEEFRAPHIVSDAGAVNTFARMLPKEIAERHGLLKKLRTIPPSIGHLCLYVGLDGTAEEIGLPGTNLWLYPDEKHDENFERFLKDPAQPFPCVYISFPSAKDPTFTKRYPGKATIEVIAPVPYATFKNWENTRWYKRGADYDALKAKFEQRLLDKLYAKVPQVRGKVSFHELSTPLSTRHFCNYENGETYGLSHGPERFTQNFLRVKTPVDGLYLTGQDLMTCGVASALFGGVLTAASIGGLKLMGEVMSGKAAA